MSNPRADPHSIASEGDDSDKVRKLIAAMEPKPQNITVVNNCGSIKVQFGGVTHINFRLDRYLGFQTWKHSDKHYCIEIVLAGDAKIESWYDDREKWTTIIAGLDQAVAQ